MRHPQRKIQQRVQGQQQQYIRRKYICRQGNYSQDSVNGKRHSKNYLLMLVAAVMYAKRVMAAKYKDVCAQYTSPSSARTCALVRQDKDYNSDAPQKKRKKEPDKSNVFATTFYHHHLGHVNQTNTDATVVVWQLRELLHKVL